MSNFLDIDGHKIKLSDEVTNEIREIVEKSDKQYFDEISKLDLEIDSYEILIESLIDFKSELDTSRDSCDIATIKKSIYDILDISVKECRHKIEELNSRREKFRIININCFSNILGEINE